MDAKSVPLLLRLLRVALLLASFTPCEATELDEPNGYGDVRGDSVLHKGTGKSDRLLQLMLFSSQTIHPYSFSYREENHRYFPKPRLHQAAKVRKIMGLSVNPFWMSVERPRSVNGDRVSVATHSPAVQSATSATTLKLSVAVRELNFTLVEDSGTVVKATEATTAFMARWLVSKATCGITYSWHDLGSMFWPRWVRKRHCEAVGGSCSWPAGMSCTPALMTEINILIWHCWRPRNASTNTKQPVHHCSWQLLRYPVVTACGCGCAEPEARWSP